MSHLAFPRWRQARKMSVLSRLPAIVEKKGKQAKISHQETILLSI
jgi:hypothetical protein